LSRTSCGTPRLTDADKTYYTDAVLASAQRPEQRLEVAYVGDHQTTSQAM
jgi:hypothetical protein